MRKSLSSLAALAFAGFAASGLGHIPSVMPESYAPATRQRRSRRRTRYFDDGPRGYPGAKLARKASEGRLGKATIR